MANGTQWIRDPWTLILILFYYCSGPCTPYNLILLVIYCSLNLRHDLHCKLVNRKYLKDSKMEAQIYLQMPNNNHLT
jgi:hypothetical protein